MSRFFLATLLMLPVAVSDSVRADGLPPELQAVKQQIVEIASANTTSTQNIPAVREELEPLIEQLETWFIANRPTDEIDLTQVPWQNLWYDDPDISFDVDLGFFQVRQPRDQIYQVVEDGFYYNVSEIQLVLFGNATTFQSYLKGAYDIIRPADAQNVGEPRLNTVALEFVANSIRFGGVPGDIPLSLLVNLVDLGIVWTIPVPGPIGVTGELWNRYVDDDLRIAAGFNNSEPEVIDLYILRRTVTAD